MHGAHIALKSGDPAHGYPERSLEFDIRRKQLTGEIEIPPVPHLFVVAPDELTHYSVFK